MNVEKSVILQNVVLLMFASLFLAGNASAQTTLEEIVVTAEKREATVQDTTNGQHTIADVVAVRNTASLRRSQVSVR